MEICLIRVWKQQYNKVTLTRKRSAAPFDTGASNRGAISNNIRLEAAIATRKLPRCHAARGKFSNLIFEIDSTNPNDVHLVSWVVQGSVTKIPHSHLMETHRNKDYHYVLKKNAKKKSIKNHKKKSYSTPVGTMLAPG